MLTDAVGQEVAVGDMVSYLMPYQRSLIKSKVKKVNPKTITLENGTVRFPDQFIVITSRVTNKDE